MDKLVMRLSGFEGRAIGRKDSVLAPFASKAMYRSRDAKKIVASNPKLIKNENDDQITGRIRLCMSATSWIALRPGSNRFATRRQFAGRTVASRPRLAEAGAKVTFDPKKERFVNDAEANRLRLLRRKPIRSSIFERIHPGKKRHLYASFVGNEMSLLHDSSCCPA